MSTSLITASTAYISTEIETAVNVLIWEVRGIYQVWKTYHKALDGAEFCSPADVCLVHAGFSIAKALDVLGGDVNACWPSRYC